MSQMCIGLDTIDAMSTMECVQPSAGDLQGVAGDSHDTVHTHLVRAPNPEHPHSHIDTSVHRSMYLLAADGDGSLQ